MDIIKKYRSIPVQAKATLWFMVCTVLQRCVALLTTPIFTRLMSQEQYGQFTIYNSWLQIFTIITTLRLNWSVFSKGMSKYRDDRDGYTSTMQTITLLLTAAVFVVYLLFAEQINALTELPTIIMVAMFVELAFFPAVEFWTVRKRFEYNYTSVVARTLLMSVLNAVIGVVAVLFSEEKGYARILSVIGVNFAFGVVLFIYNLRKGKKLFVKEYAVFALKFNLPLLLHYLSVYVLDQFNRIIIQKMVGMAAAALFGVAYSAGMVLKVVTQSLNNALVPWQYEKLERQEHRSLGDTMTVIFALVAVVVIAFSLFAPEAMWILGDEEYYDATYIVPPVALGLFFSFLYTSFANIEFFYDRNRFTMYISVGGAILNVVLNYVGIKLFGFVMSAYATMICYMLFALAHYIYMTVCVRAASADVKMFSGGRLLVLSLGTVALVLLAILLYPYLFVRIMIVVAIAAIALMKRKELMAMAKKIRAAKKNK